MRRDDITLAMDCKVKNVSGDGYKDGVVVGHYEGDRFLVAIRGSGAGALSEPYSADEIFPA